ncbi:Signal recognition particle receptor FtsY [Streptomyces griseoloalbus]
MDRAVHTENAAGGPGIVMVVGVNGTGKTTTTGKLARVLVADGNTVVLGAADTFRAAAADQLETWGERVGAHTVRGPEGGDPASVAFDAVKEGKEMAADVVLIDTAGRLHTKTGLMDELGKVKRVVEKQAPLDEVLLVLDATTGQNGLVQARVFAEVVDITGIVLAELDGTAKGGIVVAVQRELGVPVKLIGLGEGADDLAPFEPDAFVDALIGESPAPGRRGPDRQTRRSACFRDGRRTGASPCRPARGPGHRWDRWTGRRRGTGGPSGDPRDRWAVRRSAGPVGRPAIRGTGWLPGDRRRRGLCL